MMSLRSQALSFGTLHGREEGRSFKRLHSETFLPFFFAKVCHFKDASAPCYIKEKKTVVQSNDYNF